MGNKKNTKSSKKELKRVKAEKMAQEIIAQYANVFKKLAHE